MLHPHHRLHYCLTRTRVDIHQHPRLRLQFSTQDLLQSLHRLLRLHRPSVARLTSSLVPRSNRRRTARLDMTFMTTITRRIWIPATFRCCDATRRLRILFRWGKCRCLGLSMMLHRGLDLSRPMRTTSGMAGFRSVYPGDTRPSKKSSECEYWLSMDTAHGFPGSSMVTSCWTMQFHPSCSRCAPARMNASSRTCGTLRRLATPMTSKTRASRFDRCITTLRARQSCSLS